MQTYSHLLLTAVAGDVLKGRNVAVRLRAFVFGSFMPDVPLYVIGAGFIAWTRWLAPALGVAAVPGEHIFGSTFDTLYFTHPFWIVSHNLLHAPFNLIVLGLLGWWGQRTGKPWGAALLWFALGCGLHSIVDILTHYDDGPLVFFPFNWSYRFQAPVSYWDPRHGGRVFGPLEHVLDLGLAAYLGLRWWQSKRLRTAT
jgi:membrane-bound metal-dependent hydrolase YbcI (DUF457 family)